MRGRCLLDIGARCIIIMYTDRPILRMRAGARRRHHPRNRERAAGGLRIKSYISVNLLIDDGSESAPKPPTRVPDLLRIRVRFMHMHISPRYHYTIYTYARTRHDDTSTNSSRSQLLEIDRSSSPACCFPSSNVQIAHRSSC
jgi:hypothetical protein